MTKKPTTDHDWTIHSINIHGVFFERLCQQVVSESPGWSIDAVNYPVEFPPPNGPIRGNESTLDIRASRDFDDNRLSLLIECKKNNPEFVDWVFFERPHDKATPQFIVSMHENIPRTDSVRGWRENSYVRPLAASIAIANEARETRGNYISRKKDAITTKTSNAAIHEAAYQVALAKQSIAHEDASYSRRLGAATSSAPMPWRTKTYVPTILTTARLFLCSFDAKDVDSATGEIEFDKAKLSERASLVFEYPLPRHLQWAPVDVAAAYKEGLTQSFTHMHIVIVQSKVFADFLQNFFTPPAPTAIDSVPK